MHIYTGMDVHIYTNLHAYAYMHIYTIILNGKLPPKIWLLKRLSTSESPGKFSLLDPIDPRWSNPINKLNKLLKKETARHLEINSENDRQYTDGKKKIAWVGAAEQNGELESTQYLAWQVGEDSAGLRLRGSELQAAQWISGNKAA